MLVALSVLFSQGSVVFSRTGAKTLEKKISKLQQKLFCIGNITETNLHAMLHCQWEL